jgi:hypothetical protein
MAEIKFVGFVEDWTKNNAQHPDWGMRVSEPHRKKDGEEWVTVGRTYRTIKAGYDVRIDFTQFKKGDRVEVIGKELTESSEKDGKRYDNLIVKAETVTRVEGKFDATAALKSAGAKPIDEAF